MVTGMYKTCAYFLWKPKPISPETKLSNTQPAEQVSGPDCPAGHCQLAQITAQHKASSMRTNAPHIYTHPSCKHPDCTKRKSDEDPHQGGTPDTATTARARFQLSPREAHRSSDDHAGQAWCRGSRCQADTHPATHLQCHRVLLHIPTAGEPRRRPGGRAGQHSSSSETLRRNLAGSSPPPSWIQTKIDVRFSY